MRRTKGIIVFSLLRLGFFAVPLALALWLRVHPLYATIIAAVLGFVFSWLFLGKLRAKAIENYLQLRDGWAAARKRQSDE